MGPFETLVEEVLFMRNQTLKWEELVTRNLVDEVKKVHHTADQRFSFVWNAIMVEKYQYSVLHPLSFQPQEVNQLDEFLLRVNSNWNLVTYGVNNLIAKINIKRSVMPTLAKYLEDEERLRSCHILDLKVLQSDVSWKVMNSVTARALIEEWETGQIAIMMCVETLESVLVRWRLTNQRLSSQANLNI